MPARTLLVHASCIALGRRAALLRGRSGSGKSDLALRFLAAFGGRTGGARLIADDQVRLTVRRGGVFASAPKAIAGRIEVRGLGIMPAACRGEARVSLVVDLVAPRAVPRLPPRPLPCVTILGVALPLLRLAPFESSAPAKLALALEHRL